MKTRHVVLAVALAASSVIAVSGCTPTHEISVYSEEDLSGPSFTEPISTLNFAYSGGWVCYAWDKTHEDVNQYYVDCKVALAARAHIGKAL